MASSLFITNTLSGEKEQFVPITEGRVGMYACGLTPYDHPHLGHILAAIRFDVIRRYLSSRGYAVDFVENITDVDDKIIARAQQRGMKVTELIEPFIAEYEDLRKKFGLLPPTYTPRISRYIPQTISYIEALIKNDAAYATEEGNVYFSVSSSPAADSYGALSGVDKKEVEASGRVENEPDKRDARDFALWKADDTSGARWESPWGLGRPGWHIECSVMAQEVLGKRFDIHGGGMDLLFPHHENERAQAIAKTGADSFAQYWIHSGLLFVDGKKMSKSLDNFITGEEALRKYGAELLKFAVLRFHYRSPVPFSEQLLRENINTVKMFADAFRNISKVKRFLTNFTRLRQGFGRQARLPQSAFEEKMDDDFNTPEALVVLTQQLEKGVNPAEVKRRCNLLGLFERRSDEILDELLVAHRHLSGKDVPTRLEIEEQLKERDIVRAEKNFSQSDRIRDQLKERGIQVLDTSEGSQWQFDISH